MQGCSSLSNVDVKRQRRWRMAAAAGMAFAVLASNALAAQEIRVEPTTLFFGAATPPSALTAPQALTAGEEALLAPSSQPEIPQALRDKASREGGVRLIVKLAAPFTPEGRLDSIQALDQRQAIDRAQDAVLRQLEGRNAKVHARFKHIPFLALEVDAAALDVLARLPQVAAIQEDVLEKPHLASSTAVIGAGVAWASGLTGAGQVIAVLDTGVDKTHPFFSSGPQNKVVSEACYSSTTGTSAFDNKSLCPGGVQESTAPGSGVNCSFSGCEHGTHVAGIAAGDDGVGPNFGVARGASIIAIQVFSGSCGGFCLGGSFVSDQIKGLERVYELADDFHIAAVNMSLGSDLFFSRASCDAANLARKAAIDNLRSLDIATVASSGNSFFSFGGISAPACISSAISVGATDDDDNIAPFSNIAPFLDLMAPGVSVVSSVPGGGTASFDGTSMAAPHVAGAWAVLKQAHPSATVSDLLAILRESAKTVGSNLRRIDLGKAVVAGPFDTREFTIHNDGSAVLSILSMQLESLVPWIRWSPEAPFDVPPGGSRQVRVAVDFGAAPAGTSMNRLVVTSNDADESPFPDGVHLVIDKEACHALTRTRAAGSGSLPIPSPSSSPGCAPGEYHAGEVVQLAATPATGWAVESWSGTDDDGSTASLNSVTMPAGPRAVSVSYFALCFALTLSHTGMGADPVASPTNSPGCPVGEYHFAEPIQLTAAPVAGWRVGGWTHTSSDASHKLTNSLTMPANAVTVSVSYLEGLPTVLLVNFDTFFSPSDLTTALDALGKIYEIWNVADGSPAAADLAPYPQVLWRTSFVGGLDANQESALADYLDGGGSLLLNSPRHLFDRGLTEFSHNYLGVTSFTSAFTFSVTGRGSAFNGLGTLNVFSDFTSSAEPGPGAEVALENEDGASVGISKIGPTYRTLFLTLPLFDFITDQQRQTVLGAGLDFLGTIFADVPPKYWARKWIESLHRNGITSGCGTNPRIFCPELSMTRDQMAVFLLLSKEGPGFSPPACTTPPFNDVPVSSPFCPWIQELAQRGVTSGCGGGNYCPQTVVTRAQMAVFLLATLEGPGFAPPPCLTSTPFADVSAASPFCPWIQELANRGVTGGCGGGNFCPSNPVNRAQMAVFLVTNFGLPF
jgi:subtilisin family serine protease